MPSVVEAKSMLEGKYFRYQNMSKVYYIMLYIIWYIIIYYIMLINYIVSK